MKETVSLRIKKLREEKGLTKLELANKLNLSNQIIGEWENGEYYPDITLLPQLALIFDVSIDYLLTGTQPEIISLDDMDLTKRREYIIKKDDLDAFLKYDYDRKDDYYDRHYTIDGTGHRIRILNSNFWDSIFKNKAYKIFSHCIEDLMNNCKTLIPSDNFKISYIEVMTSYINDFMEFVVKYDRADWLANLNFKFAKINDVNGALFKTSENIVNAVKLIFTNKEKCPNCFKYIIDIEHKSKRDEHWYWNWTYLDNLIIEECIKYKLYNLIISFFEGFKKETLEFKFDHNYSRNYSVSGTYILLTNPYAQYPYIKSRCVTATKEHIYQLIEHENFDLIDKLLDYNKDIINILETQHLRTNGIFLMTKDEIQDKRIELDKKLTLTQKNIKKIDRCKVLSIDLLEELWKSSVNESNLKLCINYLNSKPLSYYEYFSLLINNNDWKSLFEIAVDNEFEYIIKLLAKGDYTKAGMSILASCLNRNSQDVGNTFTLNDNIFNFENYRYISDSNEILNNLKKKSEIYKKQWIEEKNVELYRFNLVEKMNAISQDISKDYIKEELDKYNIDLVIIKLCTKLESRLAIKYNREDNLFNLLNEYYEKDAVKVEFDNYFEENREVKDEEQIKLLNKLRMYRNNIAHPQKDIETLTVDELEKCIDYVFNI